jgi:hypothetical protein
MKYFLGLCFGIYDAQNRSEHQNVLAFVVPKNRSGAQKPLNTRKIYYLSFCAAQEQFINK